MTVHQCIHHNYHHCTFCWLTVSMATFLLLIGSMGISLEQYRSIVGTNGLCSFKIKTKSVNSYYNRKGIDMYFPVDTHFNNDIYIIIIYCFIIFYIFLGLQALTLNSTSSSLFHSLSQPSFYNIVHIPTVTVTFLKYINILYVTLFKLLITQQVYNVSSVTRYLKSGIKSIKNFVLTSLSL